MFRTILPLAALALCVGCGGGGPAAAAGVGDTPDAALAQRMIIQDDQDGDGQPDLITLDTSEQPYRIVEVILGSSVGAPQDATALFRGDAIDQAVSEALAQYLSSSFRVGERTPLDVTDSRGQVRSLVVFE